MQPLTVQAQVAIIFIIYATYYPVYSDILSYPIYQVYCTDYNRLYPALATPTPRV